MKKKITKTEPAPTITREGDKIRFSIPKGSSAKERQALEEANAALVNRMGQKDDLGKLMQQGCAYKPEEVVLIIESASDKIKASREALTQVPTLYEALVAKRPEIAKLEAAFYTAALGIMITWFRQHGGNPDLSPIERREHLSDPRRWNKITTSPRQLLIAVTGRDLPQKTELDALDKVLRIMHAELLQFNCGGKQYEQPLIVLTKETDKKTRVYNLLLSPFFFETLTKNYTSWPDKGLGLGINKRTPTLRLFTFFAAKTHARSKQLGMKFDIETLVKAAGKEAEYKEHRARAEESIRNIIDSFKVSGFMEAEEQPDEKGRTLWWRVRWHDITDSAPTLERKAATTRQIEGRKEKQEETEREERRKKRAIFLGLK